MTQGYYWICSANETGTPGAPGKISQLSAHEDIRSANEDTLSANEGQNTRPAYEKTLSANKGAASLDNPDQRIAADCRMFCDTFAQVCVQVYFRSPNTFLGPFFFSPKLTDSYQKCSLSTYE